MTNFNFNEKDPEKMKQEFKKHCPGEGKALIVSMNGIQVARKDNGEIFFYKKGEEIKL